MRIYELVLMPYLDLGATSQLRFGAVTLWNADEVDRRVSDAAARTRVREIVTMYRQRGGRQPASAPLRHVGLLSHGATDLRVFTDREYRDLTEFRSVMFLACLGSNVVRAGRNSGFSLYTTENFDIIRQRFALDSDSFAETAGVLVQITALGYSLKDVHFTLPPYVNRPSQLNFDETLLRELRRLRRVNTELYRRILRATGAFIESYYNAPSVNVGARILLQAAAFEALLDLPERNGRLAFKDHCDRLLARKGERRYRYKIEVGNRTQDESRTLKGIWADRFFTVRNHIIHGNVVHAREFVFRGAQHHVVVAPMVFVLLIHRLIDEWRATQGNERLFYWRLQWGKIEDADVLGPEVRGFSVEPDFFARFTEHEERRLRAEAQARLASAGHLEAPK